MSLDKIIDSAYQRIARERFSIKQKCSRCNGSGKLPDYNLYSIVTASTYKPCDQCAGKGEVIKP
jgi:DnaJ-class molecular chaperone